MRNIAPIQFTNDPVLSTKLVVTIEPGIDYINFYWTLFTEDGAYTDNGIVRCDEGCEDAILLPYEFVASIKELVLIS